MGTDVPDRARASTMVEAIVSKYMQQKNIMKISDSKTIKIFPISGMNVAITHLFDALVANKVDSSWK